MKRQKFRKLKCDRELILYLIFVLRAVSHHHIVIQYEKGNTYIRNLLDSLVKTRYLRRVNLITEQKIYYLTAKGYRYVTQEFLKNHNPQYKHLTSSIRRVPIYDHHYMNFKFVWDYLHKNWEKIDWKKVKIFTDQDRVNCKVDFDFQGKQLTLRPDVLISSEIENSTSKNLILVENDTGKEHYSNLVNKFLQYAMMLKSKNEHFLVDVERIDLYFTCVSEKRLENIFFTNTLVKRFDFDNEIKGYFDVEAKEIVKAFSNEDFNLFISVFGDNSPKIHDMEETLSKNGILKHYLD